MPELRRIPLRGSWDAPTRTLDPGTPADDPEVTDERDPSPSA